MPGPRKNLTPLDMQMLGLAYNQGGIINFLGNQPEVTAPIRAQSHVDSPPTQLAYITDAEKDLLVNANIHGSMAGKPNQGPAGLESLDDFFITPSGGIAGGSGEQVFASGVDNQSSNQQSPGHPSGGYNPDLSSQAGGYESSEAYGIQPSMAVSPSGQVWQTTDFVPAPEQADKPGSLVKVSPEKQEKLKALALAKLGADTAQKQQDTLLGKAEDIKTLIMGGGKGGNLKLTKEEAYANLPAGMHPLRKQYEYLSKKYGPDWQKTTHAKELANYLSGVPVERGGGLGAKDPNYGGGAFEMEGITAAQFKEAEAERQRMLMKVSRDLSKPTGLSSKFGKSFYDPKTGKMTGDSRFYYGNPKERQDRYGTNIYSGMNEELAFAGLNPSQKQNFIRQLIAADPSLGNKYGKDVYGSSVGKFLKGIMPYTIPGGGLIKQLLPEQDKQEYQTYGDDNQLFYDTSVPDDPKTRYTGLGSYMGEERWVGDQYGDGGGGDTTPPPDDETPPGDENQFAFAPPGQIGYWNPITGQYEYGTMGDYLSHVQVKDGGIIGLYNGGYLNNSDGIVGLDGGGYLDDYQAADSLMFKDPQEEEEWEYNV